MSERARPPGPISFQVPVKLALTLVRHSYGVQSLTECPLGAGLRMPVNNVSARVNVRRLAAIEATGVDRQTAAGGTWDSVRLKSHARPVGQCVAGRSAACISRSLTEAWPLYIR